MADRDPGNPTLDDWKQIEEHEEGSGGLNRTIRAMQQTRFHRWGFVLYRCTYSDDAAWEYYIQALHDAVRSGLEDLGRDLLLFKYFKLDVIGDRDTLENASKDYVRQKFAQWSSAHQGVEQGGPGTDSSFARQMPLFRYCLYADQKCLDTVKAHREWTEKLTEEELARSGPMFGEPKLPCVIVEKDCDPEGEGPDGYPDVDGCTQRYTGWMYTQVTSLPALYNSLHARDMADGAFRYKRPPLVYPMGTEKNAMPL